MEVQEVQSRSVSVVHRNGRKMSVAQTTAAVPGSILSFFDRRAQTTSVPPGAEASTAGPVDVPAAASAAAVRTTVPIPAGVTATAPYAEALTAELLVCGEPDCENQPHIAEPGQTTVLSHPLLPAWSGGENLLPLLSHPLLSHPRLPEICQQDSFVTNAITPSCYHTPTLYHPGW